ncbi:hypothetical protein AKJ16_DCAP23807 [Drosera capensis]
MHGLSFHTTNVVLRMHDINELRLSCWSNGIERFKSDLISCTRFTDAEFRDTEDGSQSSNAGCHSINSAATSVSKMAFEHLHIRELHVTRTPESAATRPA